MTQTSGDHPSNSNSSGSGESGTSGAKTGLMDNSKDECEDTSSTVQEGNKGEVVGNNDAEQALSSSIISNSKCEDSPIVSSGLCSPFSLSRGLPTCAICTEPCIYFCKSCKKTGYCSKEHQKQHGRLHRPDCYPVMIQVNSLHGSHLVATRDVRRGEVILCEKPLLVAPYFSEPASRKKVKDGETEDSPSKTSLCLTCHKPLLTGSSSCSTCGWSVCSEQCEKNPTHAAQECKIFAEYPVPLSSAICDRPAQYLLVALLRILLQKGGDYHCTSSFLTGNNDHDHVQDDPRPQNSDTSKWAQFMEVVRRQLPHQDVNNSHLARSCCSYSISTTIDLISKSLGSIISQRFSLTETEIDQMVGTLRTSSFITDDGNDSGRERSYINGWGFDFSYLNNNRGSADHYASANVSRIGGTRLTVYHLGSMLISNCIPNCSWLIRANSLDLCLRATTPIRMGERLMITFVDPLLPTWERSRLLWQEKFLSCACPRCTDPTESCTFFSAIKCPCKNEERSECEGYLLPTDPLAVAYPRWSNQGSYCCCFSEMYNNRDVNEGMANIGDADAGKKNSKKLWELRVADWKCNVCLMRQPWDFIRNELDGMGNLFLQDVSFTTDTSNKVEQGNKHQNLEDVDATLQTIDNFVGRRTTHVNHFMVVRTELELLGRMSALLEGGQVAYFDQMERWALKMIELCKKGLKVVNVLCPGLNRERGRLLYFLQQALVINLLFKISKGMRSQLQPSSKESLVHEELAKRFQEVLLARKEVHEIFAVSLGGGQENRMLKAVQHDSIEMRLLKKHFKHHQNYNK